MTEKRHFRDEPDWPPVILRSPGQPEIGSPIWLDNMQTGGWTLRVRVRDENVNDELWAHWRVVQNPASGGGTTNPADLPDFVTQQIQTGTDPIRDLELRVQTNLLVQHLCHRLELVVSGSFILHSDECKADPESCNYLTNPEYFALVLPEDQADQHSASWWLYEGDGTLTDVEKADLLDSCHPLDGTTATMEPPLP